MIVCSKCGAPMVWKRTVKGFRNTCVYDCENVKKRPIKIYVIKLEDIPKYWKQMGITQVEFDKLCGFNRQYLYKCIAGLQQLSDENRIKMMNKLNELRTKKGVRGKLWVNQLDISICHNLLM